MLLVDDEPGIRKGLGAFLRLGGHQVVEAGGVREGLERAGEWMPEVLISDLRMEDGSGYDLAAGARKILPGLGVILLTGYAGKEDGGRAGGGLVDLVLEKPARPRKVREAVEILLDRRGGAPAAALPGEARRDWKGSATARTRREERRILWGDGEEES